MGDLHTGGFVQSAHWGLILGTPPSVDDSSIVGSPLVTCRVYYTDCFCSVGRGVGLCQAWANYGSEAICSQLSFLIQPGPD